MASISTLREAGLGDADALELAMKCAWLDGRAYTQADFSPPPGRAPIDSVTSSFTINGNRLVFVGVVGDDFQQRLAVYKFGELEIQSSGGSIMQAMAAGRYLRQRGAKVIASKQCLSACVLVLAGGVYRDAEPNTSIGVHRFYSTISLSGDQASEVAQEMSSAIIQYLTQMNVDAELFHKMASIPSDQMFIIPHQQLRDWNLLTSKSDQNDEQISAVESPAEDSNARKTLVSYGGRDMTGGDLRELVDVDVGYCEKQCLGETACQAFSYDRWNKVCFLKNSVGVLRREPRSIAAVRADIKPILDPRPPVFSRMRKRGFVDKPFRTLAADTIETCISLCAREDDCEAFNYVIDTAACSLLKNPGPYKQNAKTDLGMKIQPATP
jgi:hypothetical protein